MLERNNKVAKILDIFGTTVLIIFLIIATIFFILVILKKDEYVFELYAQDLYFALFFLIMGITIKIMTLSMSEKIELLNTINNKIKGL